MAAPNIGLMPRAAGDKSALCKAFHKAEIRPLHNDNGHGVGLSWPLVGVAADGRSG
jgi:hypothetical protein